MRDNRTIYWKNYEKYDFETTKIDEVDKVV